MKLKINYNIKKYNEKESIEENKRNKIKIYLKSTTTVDEYANNIFLISFLFLLI